MDVSVIIPTYNRSEQLRHSLKTLLEQRFKGESEIIIIADGCTDETVEMINNNFPQVKAVVFKNNRGAAVALNAGVRASSGNILLFLDDDMEYQPGLIAQHLKMHAQSNYQVIIGHFPLGSLPTESYFRRVIYEWTEGWQCSFEEDVSFYDALCSGHFSIRREWYDKVDGFDQRFSLWGRKDSELGHRLLKAGARFGYCPHAQAKQNYDKQPSQFLSDYSRLGQADVEMSTKHPLLRKSTLLSCYYQAPWMVRWLRELGFQNSSQFQITTEFLAGYCDQMHQQCHQSQVSEGLFWVLADCFYWQGVRNALGANFSSFVGQPLTILIYHRIAEDDNVFSVTAKTFQRQMQHLYKNGYTVLTLSDAVDRIAQGRSFPKKAVVITFDDAFQDFLEAHHILQQFNFSATLFVPTGFIGKTNDCEANLIPRGLPILDRDQLLLLAKQGVDLQAHSHTHKLLGLLSFKGQEAEIVRCKKVFEDTLGITPRHIAYPTGSFNQLTLHLLNEHGFLSGLTCVSTQASKDSDLMLLPRVTVEEGSLEDFIMRLTYGIGLYHARHEYVDQITRFRPAKWWHTAPDFDPNRIYIYQTKRQF